MASVDIGAETYQAFADVDYADIFNGGDMSRAAIWATQTDDNKGRALVSATRKLLQLNWVDGPPLFDETPAPVKDACSAFAADIAQTPALAATSSTQSNIKRVQADTAQVEFFKQGQADILPIPASVYTILQAAGLIATGLMSEPYFSDCGNISPFDQPISERLGVDWRYG